MEAFDTIIVGGGSAGCVLANRLSASSRRRVMLIESGPDVSEEKVPPEISDSYPGVAYFDPRFHWTDLKARLQPVSHNNGEQETPTFRRYEQARVLGGGSAINGQQSNRGSPTDYDEWEARGASGWNWDNVLPYFRKVERDLDFDGPLHGTSGLIPLRRIPREAWCLHARAVAEAMRAAGYQYVADQNGEYKDGFFAPVISNIDERRVSAADAYLDRSVRGRRNLTISTDSTVTELIFDGKVCIGVRATVDSQNREFHAREVILSTGAIHTPAQLLRAGIGPAGHLSDLGIPVRAHLAGVGERLMDHPSIAIASFMQKFARMSGGTRRHIQVALRYSSGLPDAPSGDMCMLGVSKSAWHAVGDQIGSLVLFVNKTYSETGQVRLTDRNPESEPTVNFNLLSDFRDVERLMQGFRWMAELQTSDALGAVTANPFPASYSDRVRKLGVVSPRNRVLTNGISKMLDGPKFLRGWLIDKFVVEGPSISELLEDSEKLENFIRNSATGVWHASCSCRMGAASDPMAVTDELGMVRGVTGLRIVDASLFPCVPCANTNLPTLMVAERIADLIETAS